MEQLRQEGLIFKAKREDKTPVIEKGLDLLAHGSSLAEIPRAALQHEPVDVGKDTGQDKLMLAMRTGLLPQSPSEVGALLDTAYKLAGFGSSLEISDWLRNVLHTQIWDSAAYQDSHSVRRHAEGEAARMMTAWMRELGLEHEQAVADTAWTVLLDILESRPLARCLIDLKHLAVLLGCVLYGTGKLLDRDRSFAQMIRAAVSAIKGVDDKVFLQVDMGHGRQGNILTYYNELFLPVMRGKLLSYKPNAGNTEALSTQKLRPFPNVYSQETIEIVPGVTMKRSAHKFHVQSMKSQTTTFAFAPPWQL